MDDEQTQASPRGDAADAAVSLLADTPITRREGDYFGYAAHADAVAEIIDSERTGTPLTIAVTGAWGAGKTSLARMVQSRLREWTDLRRGDRPMTLCWFNAWLHDDAPHLGAALAAQVAQTANGQRRWWRRLLFPLPEALLGPGQRWRRRAGLLLGLLLLTAITAVAEPTRTVASSVALPKVVGGSLGVIAFAALVLCRKVFGAVQDAARFIQAPPAEASIGALGRARVQLERLIRQARRGGRFVIFVDDLERCRPPRAIEICEAANQLLGHRGVVTVVMADMEVIAASARMKYKDLVEAHGDGRLIGHQYLEKMIQLEVPLPPPRDVDMKAMLTEQPPLLEPTRRVRATKSPDDNDPDPLLRSMSFFVSVASAIGVTIGVSIGVVGEVMAVVIIGGSAGFVIVSAAVPGVRSWLQARRRRGIDERIRVLAPDTAQADLEARVLEEIEGGQEELARKQVRSYLIDEAVQLREVRAFIIEHPPALPRSAKRMLNHARLLTRIALDRGVFGGHPQLLPAHLGKWIVICERWSALGEAVSSNPSLIEDLEREAEQGDLAAALPAGIDAGAASDMRAVLRSEPPLSEVVERLVWLAPGVLPTSETNAA